MIYKLLIIVTVLVVSWMPISGAVTLGSHSVGIVLSKTCLALLSTGHTSDCPHYADLIQLDNSNQVISGGFDSDGFREKPNLTNSWRYYDHDTEWLVFVDPPRGYGDRMKLITIQPNFDVYFQPESFSTILHSKMVASETQIDCLRYAKTNTSEICVEWEPRKYEVTYPVRTVFHDRYVDDKCKNAVVNAEKWKLLVADTIHYMRNNCDDSQTSFNHVEYIPIELTQHDIATSYKYKLEAWIDHVKQHCIFKYRSC